MGDPGLLVRELEPPFFQEVSYEGLDLVPKEFLRGASDQEIIRIADQVDLIHPLLLRRPGEVFRQEPLQSVQGPVRQRGWDGPALRGAFRGGEPGMLLQET